MGVGESVEKLERRSLSVRVLEAVTVTLRMMDRVVDMMGYVSGVFVLGLSFFIVVDALGRKFFHFSSAATDEIGGYTLATASAWGFAYALRTGSHVRIDVLLPLLPGRIRRVLDHIALGTLILFSSILTFKAWTLVLSSIEIRSKAISGLGSPLFIPQGLLAVGVSILALHAIAMELVALGEALFGLQARAKAPQRAPSLVEQQVGDPPRDVQRDVSGE